MEPYLAATQNFALGGYHPHMNLEPGAGISGLAIGDKSY